MRFSKTKIRSVPFYLNFWTNSVILCNYIYCAITYDIIHFMYMLQNVLVLEIIENRVLTLFLCL